MDLISKGLNMPRFISYFLGVLFFFNQSSFCYAEAVISENLIKSFEKKDKVDVLIHLNEKADLTLALSILDRSQRVQFVFDKLTETAKKSQKKWLDYLKQKGYQTRSYYIENAILVRDADKELIQNLSLWDDAQSFTEDVQFKMKEVDKNHPELFGTLKNRSDLELRKVEAHLEMIQVDKVWRELNVRGKGIVIGGQDTGYFWRHNSLIKKYRGFNKGQIDHNYNWHNAIRSPDSGACANANFEPCDDKDHGTHTMGTMVGDDEKGNQIGVAPEAQWIGCRNMKLGEGSVSTYLDCFEFLMAPYPLGGDPVKDAKPSLAAHIVNNSWSCPVSEGCRGDEFLESVRAYKAAGILLVVAASNNGPNCGTASDAPAKYSGELISVGAYNTILNEIAFFSARGPTSWNNNLAPTLTAPGAVIRSSITKGPDSYDDKPGTSMASPQVAGVAALLWSYRPELIGQIEATMDILQKSATPFKAKDSCPGFPAQQIPNAEFGFGMVNAYRALIQK